MLLYQLQLVIFSLVEAADRATRVGTRVGGGPDLIPENTQKHLGDAGEQRKVQ